MDFVTAACKLYRSVGFIADPRGPNSACFRFPFRNESNTKIKHKVMGDGDAGAAYAHLSPLLLPRTRPSNELNHFEGKSPPRAQNVTSSPRFCC